MIDTKKDTSKASDDSEELQKPIRIVDEALDAYQNREVRVDLRFFKGLLVGAVISALVYLAIFYLLLR